MSCGRITRAGERAKLLDAAYGAAHVPLPTVEHSEGEVGQDRGLEITGRYRGRGSLIGRRAPLPTLVLHRQVVGQPPQMPGPGDLADAAQLQRSTILLHAPLRTVLGERREAQPNLGLLLRRRHRRERRHRQLFGLLIATRAVEQPHRFGDQQPVLGTFRTGEATLFSWDVAVQKARTAIAYSNNSNTLAQSTRTVGFLAQSHFAPGIDANHAGPYFGQQE